MKTKWILGAAALGFLLIAGAQKTFAKFEQEQLALESQLQERIEGILSKTLPPNSYLVTVKVEMEDKAPAASVRSQTGGGEPNNPFLTKNRFMLPGVPQKREFAPQSAPGTNETVVNAFSAETLVRRIVISILVSEDVSEDQIRSLRDIISGSIPFNPLRGDEMDIQASPLLKRASGNTAAVVAAAADRAAGRSGGFLSGLSDRANLPALILISALLGAVVVFLAFLFGPVRAFLNRLLAVLPRVGEQAAYTVTNAPAKPSTGPAGVANPINVTTRTNGVNGHGSDEGADMPFRFIREDQLSKLPILFRQMPPPQCALVLAYLPPEWASHVLAGLDTAAQTNIMKELSQAREVPAEAVKEVEAQIKAKLPYLVGGADWIQSVYQLTQPQTQRVLLGTLNQQSPELAQALRRKTFFFEDLGIVNAGALRLLSQEIGFPTVALCLKDEKPEVREALLRKLPLAMREIILQEVEMAPNDKVAVAEAKARLVSVGRRLLQEGRISLPERK